MASFLVKGEISGIQDFIFAVPNQVDKLENSNEKIPISHFLKGRSLFVEYLSQVLVYRIKQNLKKKILDPRF